MPIDKARGENFQVSLKRICHVVEFLVNGNSTRDDRRVVVGVEVLPLCSVGFLV